MPKYYLCDSAAKTRKLGESLAKKISGSKKLRKKAEVLSLEGDLGGGKTTFLQGFAKGLGISRKILSPTFIIMRRFSLKKNAPFANFYHLDCYRLKNAGEIKPLGFKKIIKDPKNLVAVEWPGNIKKAMPKNPIKIRFIFIGAKKRKISINL